MNADIDAVLVAATDDGPVGVVVLDVGDDRDVLPISVGVEAAADIARGVDAAGPGPASGAAPDRGTAGRPRTHDLMLDAVEELGGRLDRVVVSDVEDDDVAAAVHLDTPREEVVLSARTSDSLALASRTGAAIEVADPVFEAGRRPRRAFENLDDIREVGEEV